MSKKLVDRNHLHYLAAELWNIKLYAPVALQERIEGLIQYVDENIIQQDQDSKNEFKRVVYKRMKEATTEEESKQWHELYKRLDDTFDSE